MQQFTSDFDARFREGDTPWEDPVPWHGLESLFQRFVEPGASVLDFGCGHGTNALRLAALGYRVTAIDVSPTAIATAQVRCTAAGLSCDFRTVDFLAEDCGRHDVVFDRGCLHGFADDAGRSAFASAVASALEPSGMWLDISGSADNGDPPELVRELQLPRLSLAVVARAVEPFFETVELRRDVFGCTPDTDFRAWVGVFRRRVANARQA